MLPAVEKDPKKEHPMPQRAATIESLPAAFEVVKAMQADWLHWGEGYRPLGRQALAKIIETEMAVDRHLEGLEAEDAADRRNGYYRRSLMTELGDIELSVPRTRRYCSTEVVRAYARRSPDRSDDPGGFRARAFDPQAWRGLAGSARPAGRPDDGEPGGEEPR
jgi:Transposase, Mutator family